MRWVIAKLCAVAALGLGVPMQSSLAIENGTATRQPVAVSGAAPLRQALIVAPAPGGGAMASDADSYEALLRLLGFSVTTVVSETRPELEGELRRFAAAVKPGGEVALILLGTLPAKDDQLYLIPTVPVPDLVDRSDLLATEGLSVADLLRRIGESAPKDIVAVVDTCRPANGTNDCQKAAAALPDGVSALVASRRRGTDAGGPLARLTSLRPDLLPLMRQPDVSFFALFGALKAKLSGTDMTLSATPSLSRSFAFLPSDFLARLPTACNRVEATSDPAALRGRRLDDLAAACSEAARTYTFPPFFADKLATVREQLAFQRTTAAGCNGEIAANFLREYPDSPLRNVVARSQAECEKARYDADEQAAAQRAVVLQEQAAREQILREQAARNQVAEEAQNRVEISPQYTNSAEICSAYLQNYFAAWSAPNDVALAFIEKSYSPFVEYYGKVKSRQEIIEEKRQFATRWPDRSYKLLSGRYDFIATDKCVIKGLVKWSAARQTGKSSQGTAEFDIALTLGPKPFIVSETGKVVSRDH